MKKSKISITTSSDVYYTETNIDDEVRISFDVYCVGSVDKREFSVNITHGKETVRVRGFKYCVYSPIFTYIITIALSAVTILIIILAISIFLIYRQRSSGSGTFQ